MKKVYTFIIIILLILAVASFVVWQGVKMSDDNSRQIVYETEIFSYTPELIESHEVINNEMVSYTILTTGDVMLGRSVNSIGFRRRDFFWSLEQVNEYLDNFDLVVANLETPIINNCPVRDDGMLFCADASAAGALAKSQIDIVTLANNHIYNQGNDGYEETRYLLTQVGEEFVGTYELHQWENEGIKYGLIAYDDVTYPIELDEWREMIASASAKVDNLLVALHFGAEYQYQPTVRQVQLAHVAIDSGAKLIIGNHSHWLGTIEQYGDGVIIYSHGNFVFDQEWAQETKSGIVVAWEFDNGRLTAADVYPIWITNYGLAHWAAGTPEGERILQTFLQESGNGEWDGDHVHLDFVYPEKDESFAL